jgi:hypothetical protein
MSITTHWKVVVSDSYVGAKDRSYAHFWEPAQEIAERGRLSEMLYQLAHIDWRDASNSLRRRGVENGLIDEADVRKIREAAQTADRLGLEAVGKVFPLSDACYLSVELALDEARINVRIAHMKMSEARFVELIKQNLHTISDDMFLELVALRRASSCRT